MLETVILVLLQAAPPAPPQEPAPPGRIGDDLVRLTPRITLWNASLSGHLRYDDEIVDPFFPPAIIDRGTKMDLDDELGLGDAETIPVIEMAISWSGGFTRSRFGFNALFWQLKRSETEILDSNEIFASTPFPQGSQVETDLRLSQTAVQFFMETNFGNPRIAGRAAIGLDHLRVDVDMDGGALTESEETLDLLLHVSPSFEGFILPWLFARAQLDGLVGFSSLAYGISLSGGLDWEGLRLELSYRTFAWSFEDSDEDHQIRLGGPALSVAFAF